MAVVDLREVVEGAGLLGVGEPITPPVVLDLDEAFLDVDVGRPVLAHGAQLHQVRLGRRLPHREEQVQGPHDVVDLRLRRVHGADHRVRRRPLLGEVMQLFS